MKTWLRTDKGPMRPQNEDSCFAMTEETKGWSLIVVCDGMGGARAGNVASSLAVNVFSEIVCDEMQIELTAEQAGKVLCLGAESANDAVYEMSLSSEEFRGMGTTLVAGLVTEKYCVILNIGDSRAYLVNEDGIRQITKDHSLVEELIEKGRLRREDSEDYPGRNLITRAVGTAENVEADIFFPKLETGEYILLCSDGLVNTISEQEILFEILHGGSREECCDRLIDLAVARDAADNVTAVLLRK